MSATVATSDPAEAMHAAVRELYDELRKLVDAADPEDPSLLDKLRKLSAGVGRKITVARKRVEQPVEPTTTSPNRTRTGDGVERPVPATAPPSGAGPAAAAPSSERVTVRLAEAGSPRHPSPVAQAADPRPHGRHRRRPRTPRWLFVVLVALAGVLGAAVAVALGNPIPLVAVAPAVGALHAWRGHRLAAQRERAR